MDFRFSKAYRDALKALPYDNFIVNRIKKIRSYVKNKVQPVKTSKEC